MSWKLYNSDSIIKSADADGLISLNIMIDFEASQSLNYQMILIGHWKETHVQMYC